MSHVRTHSDPPKFLQRWAAFDARFPWAGDILITAGVSWLTVQFYLIAPEYVPAARISGVLLIIGLLIRRYAIWVAAFLVIVAPMIVRALDSGLARDLPFSMNAPDSTVLAPYADLVAACIIAYTVAARVPRSRSVPILIGGLILFDITILIWANQPSIVTEMSLFSAFFALFILLGINVRTSRLRLTDLERRAEQLALERDQREQLAVSQERARIAREMHDVVAHSLSVMISLSDGALAALDRNPESARAALIKAAETGRGALADTRRLLGVLRDDSGSAGDSLTLISDGDDAPYAPQPTEISITTLVEQFKSTGLPVTFSETGPPLPEDSGLRLAVYRIVQEALTNVLRYAATSTAIDVHVNRTYQDVVIVVDNDAAPGSAISAGSGKGLIGMRERAAVYDGTIDAGPTATGWRVRATLCWMKE